MSGFQGSHRVYGLLVVCSSPWRVLSDTLADIEIITHQGHTLKLGPILAKQRTLNNALNIPIPDLVMSDGNPDDSS